MSWKRTSEATTPGVKQYRTSMKDVRRAVQEMFESIIPQITGVVQTASDRDGNLIASRRNATAQRAGELVQSLFVRNGRQSFSNQDGVTAVTPFAALLNNFYVRVTLEAIYNQRNWMQRNLPEDVFGWLSRQRFSRQLWEQENPFLRRDGESDEEFLARLDDLRVFRPNPMAELDPARRWVPMHQWQDTRGYRLSDRIWRASNRTRDKIDAMIILAFDEGWGALELSRELERFLLPDRANLRTNRPYGVDASFDAMRLARTEVARAANHAAYMSAYMNPYVNQIDVARSPQGDVNCTICPDHATIGIGGGRLRAPYSIYTAFVGPYHPHCVTPGQFVTTSRGKIPIEDVVIGDYVLTHKGRFRKVINAWSREYDGLVHDIRTDAGCRVELTSEHPVLSTDGWVNAEFIKPTNQVLHATVNIVYFLNQGFDSSFVGFFNASDVHQSEFLGEASSTSSYPTQSAWTHLWHDNLLSLSPEQIVGHESGNPFVEQVANPLQAQLDYNTVTSADAHHYKGLVYNMSVEEDESYVVGDIVVHNCMCHTRPVLVDSPSTVTNRLRAVMDDARANTFPPAVTPAAIDDFTSMLLHRALGTLVNQWRGQLPLAGF